MPRSAVSSGAARSTSCSWTGTGPQIRFPALPYLYDSLQPGTTVILDDIDRRGEQQIVKRWEGELGLSFERRFLNRIAISAIT